MLEVKNISVFYGKIRALNNLSLQVNAGEILAVIGSNGAGKTTLLRAIIGVTPCSSGTVKFQGQELSAQPPYVRSRMGISIVPEGRGLFPQFTVEENLMAGAFSRSDINQIKTDLEKLYERFPMLRERRRQLAGSLSGGQGQLLALARGLAGRPKLLLLDEPSMGLMPTVVSEIFKIISSLRTEGISILLVEQNAKKALSVADRAVVLQVGEMVIQGTSDELLNNDHVRKAYFGA